MSFVDKLNRPQSSGSVIANLIKQKALVYSLTCMFDGHKAWYIFEVEKAKKNEFEELFNNAEQVDFEQFGEILYSDWGEGPDEMLKEKLRIKYGLYE